MAPDGAARPLSRVAGALPDAVAVAGVDRAGNEGPAVLLEVPDGGADLAKYGAAPLLAREDGPDVPHAPRIASRLKRLCEGDQGDPSGAAAGVMGNTSDRVDG